jgi:hypothetical protein
MVSINRDMRIVGSAGLLAHPTCRFDAVAIRGL